MNAFEPITHAAGQHRIIEQTFPNGDHYFIPFSHLLGSGLESFFTWTLDAALVASIHYHNRGQHNAMTTAIVNDFLGVSDRSPDDRQNRRGRPAPGQYGIARFLVVNGGNQ